MSRETVIKLDGCKPDPSWMNDAVEIQYEGNPTRKFVTVSGPAKIGTQHKDRTGNDEIHIVTLGDTGCKGQSG